MTAICSHVESIVAELSAPKIVIKVCGERESESESVRKSERKVREK